MKKILCYLTLVALVAISCKTKQPEPPKPTVQAPTPPPVKRIEDIIYGRKFGTALTMDAFRPAKPNGFAIVALVSGGWYSGHEAVGMVETTFVRPLVERGYTVFAVVH